MILVKDSKQTSERSYCCKVLALLDAATIEAIQKREETSGLLSTVIENLRSIVEDGDDALRARGLRTLGSLIILP